LHNGQASVLLGKGRTRSLSGFRGARGFNYEFKAHRLLGNEFQVKGLDAQDCAVQLETVEVVPAAPREQ
jgi:hypothetical protein